MENLLGNVKTVIVNTGNILSLNDVTKNPGQNPAEELTEAIKLTICNYNSQTGSASTETGYITSNPDELVSKMSEHEMQDLKIGIKVFLNSDNATYLEEALEKAFVALNVSSVHNVVISLNPKDSQEQQLNKIQTIWSSLEGYVKKKKIQQIGLSDIEESTFRAVFAAATVKPSIIQINLATCCVVPPTLQEFCKQNDVLILTHSDPAEILPVSSITGIFGVPLILNWAVRFLVHIKCRGVLTTKGYIISLNK